MVQQALASQFVKSTGWRVEATVYGANPVSGETQLGVVSWVQTGHSDLTPTGIGAVLTQINTYLSGLGPILLKHTRCEVGVSKGSYSVQNTDLGAQQTAIFNILATAANVTSPAT